MSDVVADAPPPFAFDEESEAEIVRAVAKYPAGRDASAVLPVLYIAQRQMLRLSGAGWVPRTAMDAVAARLGMPAIRVYEVATFYLMFNKAKVGRYHLQVCTTTPCWLRGSDDVLDACKRFTGLTEEGDVTGDGLFSYVEVECLGACVNAPMVQVNDDYYEDLDAERTTRLLEALKRGEPPKPGSMSGRITSAPEGGPTTLLTFTHPDHPADQTHAQ